MWGRGVIIVNYPVSAAQTASAAKGAPVRSTIVSKHLSYADRTLYSAAAKMNTAQVTGRREL